MRELRNRLRLTLETDLQLCVVGERRRQNLDGDAAIEPRVARFVDLPHPARTNRRDDFIGTEAAAGRYLHRCGGGMIAQRRAHHSRGASGVLTDRDSSEARIARSTHSVVVTPAASATTSSRNRRFIGNRHVTAMRRDVRTGLPAFARFSTGGFLLRWCNHALPDAEPKPDVLEDEKQ